MESRATALCAPSRGTITGLEQDLVLRGGLFCAVGVLIRKSYTFSPSPAAAKKLLSVFSLSSDPSQIFLCHEFDYIHWLGIITVSVT